MISKWFQDLISESGSLRWLFDFVTKYNYLDFLIEDKVVLELKVANDFYQSDINQILAYLKAKNYHLGILAVYKADGVKIKRLVN